jgi:hypothetical protein
MIRSENLPQRASGCVTSNMRRRHTGEQAEKSTLPDSEKLQGDINLKEACLGRRGTGPDISPFRFQLLAIASHISIGPHDKRLTARLLLTLIQIIFWNHELLFPFFIF